MKNVNKEMEDILELRREFEIEDKKRFDKQYGVDEFGFNREKDLEEELKRGKRYKLDKAGEIMVCRSFKELEDQFYSTKDDCFSWKDDGFQSGTVIFTRKKGKEWSIFD